MHTKKLSTAALIGASLLTVMLAACSKVENYVVIAAQTKCANHGGLHEIYQDAWAWHAECSDGFIAKSVQERTGG